MKSAKATRVPRRKTNGKIKTRVGPVCVTEFADGQVVRMTVFTRLDRLDWERGQRLAREAYASRVRQTQPRPVMPRLPSLEHLEQYLAAGAVAAEVQPIVAMGFEERDGKVLAQRPADRKSSLSESDGGAHA